MGTMCGVITKTGGLTVLDVVGGFLISFEAACCLKGIKAFYFSPLSTYLVSTERFEPKTPEVANMSLWHVAGKSRIVDGKLRKISGASVWPSMKWTSDEACCCRVLEDNALQVLNAATSKTFNLKIGNQGSGGVVSLVEISGVGSFASVFVIQESASFIAIYDLSLASLDGSAPLSQHTFTHTVDVCSMKWNGDRLLVVAGSEIDETGGSYYGTSRLYLIKRDGGIWTTHSISHASPVHDVQWEPTHFSRFCLISGPTPFHTQIFEDTVCVYDFEQTCTRKNTIRYNKFGSFLALGGFGNLAGGLDFVNVGAAWKMFQSSKSECTVESDWAPNGRIFSTASTHPRMRVDNCITLFTYFGSQICKLEFPELYAAKWQPNAKFKNLPPSPRALVTAPVVVEKKAYRPPSGVQKVVQVDTRVTPQSVPPQVVPHVVPQVVSQAPHVERSAPVAMPCPEKDWYYKDPTGETHGPYTKAVMISWNTAGYFRRELPVRAGTVLPFVPLCTLFPISPFETAMTIPSEWLNYRK